MFADDTSIRSVISLFTTDVESAETVTAPDPAPCGGSGSALATMTWTDDGTVFRASWSTQTSGSTTTLVRQRCTGTTLVSTLLVADVQARADGDLFAELRERVDDHDDRNGRERRRLHGLGEAAAVMSRPPDRDRRFVAARARVHHVLRLHGASSRSTSPSRRSATIRRARRSGPTSTAAAARSTCTSTRCARRSPGVATAARARA